MCVRVCCCVCESVLLCERVCVCLCVCVSAYVCVCAHSTCFFAFFHNVLLCSSSSLMESFCLYVSCCCEIFWHSDARFYDHG